MKREELHKIHQMTVKDLGQEQVRLEREIASLKLKLATGKLKNLRQGTMLRHDLARVNTLMTAKSLTVIDKPVSTPIINKNKTKTKTKSL